MRRACTFCTHRELPRATSFFRRLEIDDHLDVVAEDHPAVVESLIPNDAVVFSVQRRGEHEPGDLAATIVFHRAEVLDGKSEPAGDAVHRQIAGDVINTFSAGRLNS